MHLESRFAHLTQSVLCQMSQNLIPCLQLSIQRLKEPPMHILGATFLCFSLFAGAMSHKCTLPQQPWTLISVCSAQWDCSFLFGLLFPVLPPDRMWTSSHVLRYFKDHSLALSAQYLKAIRSHLAQLYGQSYWECKSNACDSTVARSRSEIYLLVSLWASEPDQWFSNLSMPQNLLLEALFLRVAQVGKGCSSICISNEFPGDSNVVHTKTTFWRPAGLDPCFQRWLVVHRNHLEKF